MAAGGGEGKRMVKLLCPSISSKMLVQVVAREDQKLNLGAIARAFGLDPGTLKLNGHFISRGVDFIASSVTWKSLLSFFSSKGLSTGTSASDALLVHGKPCKLAGSKRAHDSAVFEYGTPSTSDQGDNSVHRKHHLDEINLSTNKRFRDSAIDTASEEDTKVGAFSLKRKHFMEDDNSMKRIRGNDGNLGAHDSAVFEYGTPSTSDQGYNSVHGKHHLDEINLSANKRFRDSAIDTARKIQKLAHSALRESTLQKMAIQRRE